MWSSVKAAVTIMASAIPSLAYSASDNILDYSLEELLKLRVVTASKVEEGVTTAPGDILVITRKQIIERGYRNLEDVLRDLPSVDVQTHSSSTSYNNIALRGIFGNSKFIVLQDGLRVSSPTGEDIPVAFNFPLHHVKQVEFIYGPASALYGADALSGVINLISLSNTDEVKNHLYVSGGENKSSYYSGLTSFKLTDNNHLALGFHQQRTDGPDLATDYPSVYRLEDLITLGGQLAVPVEERVPPEFPQKSYSAFVKFSLSNQLTIGFNRAVIEHSTATGTRPNTVDYGKRPFWKTEVDNVYLSKDWQLSDNMSSRLRVDYSAYHIDEDSKFANIFVDYGAGYKYAEGLKSALTQQFHWQINNANSLIFGATYQDFDTIPKTADLLKPFNDKVAIGQQGLVYPFVGDLPVKIFEIDWRNKGLFIQHQAKVNKQLNLTSGVRFDDSSNYGSTVNPRVGLVYEVDSKNIVKMLYGEAFVAPTPRFTHDHFGAFTLQRDDGLYQSFFMQIPNTDLKPEELQTIEFNYQKVFNNELNIQTALFHTKVKNLIDRKITEQPQSDFIQGGYISTTQIYDNVGEIDVVGADIRLSMQKQLAKASLSLNINYSYVNGELTKLDSVIDVPFVAPNKVKFHFTYRSANWVISPSFYWYDKTPNNAGEQADAYHLVNLYGHYQLERAPIRFSLNISNLTNRSYRVAAESNLGVLESVPQRKRHLALGFTYEF